MRKRKSINLNSDLFSTGDVAWICGVSSLTVRKWQEKGLLPGHRIPGTVNRHRRFRREDVVKFINDHGLPNPGLH